MCGELRPENRVTLISTQPWGFRYAIAHQYYATFNNVRIQASGGRSPDSEGSQGMLCECGSARLSLLGHRDLLLPA